MKMDTHIFHYCLTCKNHDPDKASGMDLYCAKEKMMINNYLAQKCTANKYYEAV